MSGRTAFAIVDAFTTARPFSGNPAGVLLFKQFPDSAWMQGVANELHQAETAFLATGEDGAYQLRWFTPVTEVALCGHATLASAHWLWETAILAEDAVAIFTTRSGRLTAHLREDHIVLDLPAVPARRQAASAELLAALSGPVPLWTGATGNADPSERNILAVLASEQDVRDLAPDLQTLGRMPVGGLIVTARSDRPSGVVSRCFDAYGEDPVTGSAHCTIGPYWRDELGPQLYAEQASPRGGELTVLTTDAGRVRLGGRASTAVTGFIS